MIQASSAPPSTREEIAQREIGHTDISLGTRWFLIAAFAITISAPSIVQFVYDVRTSVTRDGIEKLPSSLQILSSLPTVVDSYRRTGGSWTHKLMAANQQLLRNIDGYERQLEERSLLTHNLLGPVRSLMAEYGGVGSDKVDIGRDGWLFYRPDVEYLTGPGFLDPKVLRRRSRSSGQQDDPIQPDPRQAILEFHQQLESRGIRLIIVPTPGKASIDPEQLSSRYQHKADPLQNSSFETLKQELRAAGVLIFDPADALKNAKRANQSEPLFLRTDTHWTPAGVELVAERLAEFIRQQSLLPDQPTILYRRKAVEFTNSGDIAVMLRLPAKQQLFPSETIAIHTVERDDQTPWKPESASDVLLLGDSFTNIYSLPELKWGRDAGLAEQLSYELKRPIDRLAQNDGGAYAVRQSLLRELARGHDRLQEKKLVIWQFAARELSFGDWKLIPVSKSPDVNKDRQADQSDEEFLVQGIVQSIASVPRPGTVPYREAVIAIHLVDVNSTDKPFANNDEIVVYCWGLRDNQPTDAARFQSGQSATLRLVPWEKVRQQYERFNRIELDDPDFRLAELPLYWGDPR